MRLATCIAALVGLASAARWPLANKRDASRVVEARQAGETVAGAGQTRPTAFPIATYDQTIDHFPHSSRYVPHLKGTYKQRYAYDRTYYKSGGPIFVVLAGEIPLEQRYNYLQTGIIQILAQQFNGLGIILEARYYGGSTIFNTSTTDDLRYLTTEQITADVQEFAANVKISGFPDIRAPKTPWILYGGSLAGGQAAFVMKDYGDTIYGAIAGAGVTYAVEGYPQWYDPPQKFGPPDCIERINDIVDKMDVIMDSKNTEAITRLKDIFGLKGLKDIRDFAETISWPVGGPLNYPTNTWQELNWVASQGSQDFFDFCSNVTDLNPPANNTAVDQEMAKYTNGQPWTGLGNYAAYVKRVIVDSTCQSQSGTGSTVEECFGEGYRAQYYNSSDPTIRSYIYQTCTEVGAYQVAYPRGQKSLIPRVLQVDYTQELLCNKAFPKGKYNSIPPSVDRHWYNRYGGYNVVADRLATMDGESDVWRDLCYHTTFAPDRHSTLLHPEMLLDGSGHHWDSYGILDINAEPYIIREAHKFEIRFVTQWLADFKNWKPGSHYKKN